MQALCGEALRFQLISEWLPLYLHLPNGVRCSFLKTMELRPRDGSEAQEPVRSTCLCTENRTIRGNTAQSPIRCKRLIHSPFRRISSTGVLTFASDASLPPQRRRPVVGIPVWKTGALQTDHSPGLRFGVLKPSVAVSFQPSFRGSSAQGIYHANHDESIRNLRSVCASKRMNFKAQSKSTHGPALGRSGLTGCPRATGRLENAKTARVSVPAVPFSDCVFMCLYWSRSLCAPVPFIH
jgi:hypothetical protein